MKNDKEKEREEEGQRVKPRLRRPGEFGGHAAEGERRREDVEDELARQSRVKSGERIEQTDAEFGIVEQIQFVHLVLIMM